MGNFAVRVDNLGKAYPLARPGRRDTSPRGKVRRWLRRLWPRRPARARDADIFWALKNVSFDVQPGEVVGIIGRNGAGKSTLLKVLSRITEPTEGIARIQGRVGSLLEVGTGFHPDLTGRENVYLNGTILGMRKAEITRNFDDIVAFAEIERFIDQPVRSYSSGMYMRLAFAVAAHLTPEVLLLDEVLAVGDAAFQKKCLGKMQDVAGHGRTVLFVSHDMQSVRRLCQRAVLLQEGRIERLGPTAEVVKGYFHESADPPCARTWPATYNPRNSDVCRLVRARLLDAAGQCRDQFAIHEPIRVEILYERLSSEIDLTANFALFTKEGVCVFVASNNYDAPNTRAGLPPGIYSATCTIPANLLNEGSFSLQICLTSYHPVTHHYKEHDALGFTVVDQAHQGLFRDKYAGAIPGVVRTQLTWETFRL